MTKLQKIAKNIESDKELSKIINGLSYYKIDDFIKDAIVYIKAIKERRMLCIIKSVSNSGMSRTLKFNSFEGTKTGGYYRQYWALFSALGYKESKSNRDAFNIGGCGMDMIFHTNYTIIHKLGRLGFLNKKEVDHLAQQTPTVL